MHTARKVGRSVKFDHVLKPSNLSSRIEIVYFSSLEAGLLSSTCVGSENLHEKASLDNLYLYNR